MPDPHAEQDLRHELFAEVSYAEPSERMEPARLLAHLQEYRVQGSPQQIRLPQRSSPLGGEHVPGCSSSEVFAQPLSERAA